MTVSCEEVYRTMLSSGGGQKVTKPTDLQCVDLPVSRLMYAYDHSGNQ